MKDPPVPEVEKIRRMLRIANEIVRFITLFEVKHVGIEGPAYNAHQGAHALGELSGVVKSQLWMKFRIVPLIVPPASARKHVLGYGGSVTKDQVKEVVEKGLGVAVENDHEADATVIARFTFDTVVAREKEVAGGAG